MPQKLLHLITTGAVIDQKTRIGIARIMNPHCIQPRTLYGFKKQNMNAAVRQLRTRIGLKKVDWLADISNDIF